MKLSLNEHKEKRQEQHKATKLEHLRRIRSIQERMIEGHNIDDIKTTIQGHWKIGERQASKYIRKAFEHFREQSSNDLDQLLALHTAARQGLLKKAMANPSLNWQKFAHNILVDLAKLKGLYVYKVDHTTNGKELTSGVIILPTNNRQDDANDRTPAGLPI